MIAFFTLLTYRTMPTRLISDLQNHAAQVLQVNVTVRLSHLTILLSDASGSFRSSLVTGN
jgi:hypothetical protein